MRIQTGDRNSSSYDYGYGQESRGLLDGGARLRRPASAVETRRAALDERRELHGEGAMSAESIRLLGKASDAARRADLDGGWALLLEVERSELPGYSEGELAARVVSLRNEAGEKLRGWRRAAASELLGAEDGHMPGLDEVQEAIRIRNEHFHNQYHKLELLREQLRILAPILVAALVLFAAIVGIRGFVIGQLAGRDVVLVMLLGALGGALSGVRSLAGDKHRKIPERLYDWPVTLMRPVVGAAAALGVALLLQASVVQIGDGQLLALLAAAFVAGFSERWFLGLIESVTADAPAKA